MASTSQQQPQHTASSSTSSRNYAADAQNDDDDNNNLLSHGIVAGLLSSSCCLLQLLLNLLSWWNIIHIGCAGFNKTLGPLRPYFRTLTLAWLGICWFQAAAAAAGSSVSTVSSKTNQSPTTIIQRRRRQGRLVRVTVVTLIITFLPELLQSWDTAHPVIRRSLMMPMPDKEKAWLERKFIVDNMGCEACESHVRNLLESIPEVYLAHVEWESGRVTIWGDDDPDKFDLRAMGELLEKHGYELHENLDYVTRNQQFQVRQSANEETQFQ